MKSSLFQFVTLIIVVAVALALGIQTSSPVISSTTVQDEDSMSRRDFMRTKLMYSQNVFEGLTTKNFDLIDKGISEIERVTEGAKWVQIDSEDYRKLTSDFNTRIKRLKTAAESENIEATALRFYEMSTSCIDCHQHLRSANYEF